MTMILHQRGVISAISKYFFALCFILFVALLFSACATNSSSGSSSYSGGGGSSSSSSDDPHDNPSSTTYIPPAAYAADGFMVENLMITHQVPEKKLQFYPKQCTVKNSGNFTSVTSYYCDDIP